MNPWQSVYGQYCVFDCVLKLRPSYHLLASVYLWKAPVFFTHQWYKTKFSSSVCVDVFISQHFLTETEWTECVNQPTHTSSTRICRSFSSHTSDRRLSHKFKNIKNFGLQLQIPALFTGCIFYFKPWRQSLKLSTRWTDVTKTPSVLIQKINNPSERTHTHHGPIRAKRRARHGPISERTHEPIRVDSTVTWW